MTAKDKATIEDLLKTAKEVSGKAMPIVVLLSNKPSMEYARSYMKGKRGFKNVTLKLARN